MQKRHKQRDSKLRACGSGRVFSGEFSLGPRHRNSEIAWSNLAAHVSMYAADRRVGDRKIADVWTKWK